MAEFLGQIGDIFTDLSPGVVIGSLAIALGLAMVGSGIHALTRGGKARDPLAPLCGLMFLVSVVSMAIAVGYARQSGREAQVRPGEVGPSSPPGRTILDAADLDRDGHLTPREAVELVRRADTHRKGYADLFELDHVRGPSPEGPALAEVPGGRPGISPTSGFPEACASSVACFPPTGGVSGHETWPLMSRNSARHWPPKM